MRKIVLPNTYLENLPEPIVYLAGPIQSAPKWQWEAVRYFPSDVTLVIPRRSIPEHLQRFVLPGDQKRFTRQREWERYYMALAADKNRKGALLFWLPGEADHHCEKAYGANSRLELGEWMTRLEFDRDLHVVFGTDNRFSDIDVIRHDLAAHGVGGALHESLERTCAAAYRFF